MKQITIVYFNGSPQLAGITDDDRTIEPQLTESIHAHIQAINAELDALKSPEQELTDQIKDYLQETAPDEVLLTFKDIFDAWQIGKDYTIGDLFVYDGNLFRVIQPITAMEHQTPEMLPAHYRRITPPGVIEPWRQPAGAHDAYQKDDKVTHKGKTWISTAKDNVWEPGVYGWDII